MDKAQLEFLIQKRMEQCVRDDYLINNQLVATPAMLASPLCLPLSLPLHECSSNTSTGTANVQQAGKAKPIQNQADNSNYVNLSFTEKYINNIYDFFYWLIHHEKYRYMDDYIFNPNNDIQESLNSYSNIYAIKFFFKPIIQKLKNKQSCNASTDECKTITTSVDIFGFLVLLSKLTIHLIKSGHCEKIDSNGENKIDWMIDAKYKKKLDKLFDYCFNEMKSAFLSEQFIDNSIGLQKTSKKTYDYNDFLIYWKSNFNYIQSVVRDIFDFDKQSIDNILTLVSNENQLLDNANVAGEASLCEVAKPNSECKSEATLQLDQLIQKRMEMIMLLFPVEMINNMKYDFT